MPGQHSLLGPSSSHRWLLCPGSTDAFYLPEKTNPEAELGTDIHDTSSKLLVGGYRHDDIETRTAIEKYEDHQQANIRVFLEAAEHYTNNFSNRWETEVRMVSTEIPDLGGTADLLTFDGHTLTVGDLKTGRIPVEADGNTQLMCYLILALERPEYAKAKKFAGFIVQFGQIDEAVFTRRQLNKVKKQIAHAAESAERVAGSHCEWCPLLRTCKEAKEQMYKNATEVFEKFDSFEVVDEEELTVEECKKFIEWAPIAEKFKALALKRMRSLMLGGQPIPGWKLGVRQSNREWRSPESVPVALESRGITECYKKTLLSPAQVEAIIGKKAVDDLVTRRDTAVVPVPERSKLRNYVSGEAILDEFEPWSGENDGND